MNKDYQEVESIRRGLNTLGHLAQLDAEGQKITSEESSREQNQNNSPPGLESQLHLEEKLPIIDELVLEDVQKFFHELNSLNLTQFHSCTVTEVIKKFFSNITLPDTVSEKLPEEKLGDMTLEELKSLLMDDQKRKQLLRQRVSFTLAKT